jgi:hypothetical protein
MLKQRRTKEGESYVSMQALKVEVPAVMGGSITITHKVADGSPLLDCIKGGVVARRADPRGWLIARQSHDILYGPVVALRNVSNM